METKRQKIVAAVITALETIKKIDGYATDLGLSINRWRIADYSLAELPGASIYDYEEKIDDGKNLDRSHFRFFKAEIEVKLAQTEDAPAEILLAFADIEKVIGIGANGNWGGLSTKTVPGGNKITVEQGTKKIAGGLISFDFYYITQPFNAYQ